MNLNKVSATELRQAVASGALEAVRIERSADPTRLSALNDILRQNPELRVVLVVDETEGGDSGRCWNMAALPHLPAVKRLHILSNSSEPLAGIAELENVESLVEFSLGGFLDRKMNLTALEGHQALESLSLDLKLSKKQCRILEPMTGLHSLNLEYANPADLPPLNLRGLKFTKPGKNMGQIPECFPRLKTLFVQKVRQSVDLAFISSLLFLEKLSINYSPGLVELPNLTGLSKLRELELLDAKNLKSLEPLKAVTSLQVLSITQANGLAAKSCAILQQLPDLGIVYSLFTNKDLEKRFARMAQESEWGTRHPSVLNR